MRLLTHVGMILVWLVIATLWYLLLVWFYCL